MVNPADPSYQNPAEHALRALLLRALDGDCAAYRAFLDQLADHLHGYLRKRLYPLLDDVDDLVQEIVFAVHRARTAYRHDEPLTAWIYAIARHKLTDYLRARSRRSALQITLDTGYNLVCASGTERADAKRDVDMLLNRLPQKQRMLIIGVKLCGLSVIEAAQLTGWSEASIKASLHRGMKRLISRKQASRASPRAADVLPMRDDAC
ncbi:sigma-70 family RNA polymerase sigma factor [Paraburkholderia rhizosphaerae]|uniref:RNA polymerase ECF family sigma subunit n=1 Tax=Paraburkholderia rhizosphaerae TaxID=480658 RepID=A0A4R8L4E6_9BURK|nr:sigma-70 family RNA polymerase sigma factor [Paraburkholderia rhizosphaerae]TDY37383.1 RNA polymerase ECF family sigma subunit [Paraburkholderia rhizosphaerae]